MLSTMEKNRAKKGKGLLEGEVENYYFLYNSQSGKTKVIKVTVDQTPKGNEGANSASWIVQAETACAESLG